MPELPPTETRTLSDGATEVTVGHLRAIVGSSHLVEAKERQLQRAWLREQGGNAGEAQQP